MPHQISNDKEGFQKTQHSVILLLTVGQVDTSSERAQFKTCEATGILKVSSPKKNDLKSNCLNAVGKLTYSQNNVVLLSYFGPNSTAFFSRKFSFAP